MGIEGFKAVKHDGLYSFLVFSLKSVMIHQKSNTQKSNVLVMLQQHLIKDSNVLQVPTKHYFLLTLHAYKIGRPVYQDTLFVPKVSILMGLQKECTIGL